MEFILFHLCRMTEWLKVVNLLNNNSQLKYLNGTEKTLEWENGSPNVSFDLSALDVNLST